MMCSASRYVLVAWFAGLLTATATGSDALGWAAAAIAVALSWALARRDPARFGVTSCAVPQRATRGADGDPAEPRP